MAVPYHKQPIDGQTSTPLDNYDTCNVCHSLFLWDSGTCAYSGDPDSQYAWLCEFCTVELENSRTFEMVCVYIGLSSMALGLLFGFIWST